MKILTPPESLNLDYKQYTKRIFLAGSIEMGKAEEWQEEAIQIIEAFSRNPCCKNFNNNTVIYNPRRKDWDSSWEQKLENPQFYQQVNWELSALENSTHILFYFAPNTLSPISLLELGRFSITDKKIAVVANSEYLRKGNIDVFCEKYKILQEEKLYIAIKKLLRM